MRSHKISLAGRKTNGRILAHIEPLDVDKLQNKLKKVYEYWNEKCPEYSPDSRTCHQDPTTGKWNHGNQDCRKNWADWDDDFYCPVEDRAYCKQRLLNLEGVWMMLLCFYSPELAQQQRTLNMHCDQDLISRYSYVSLTPSTN